MSDILNGAVAALNKRLAGGGLDGSVRFDIEDEGAVRIDENGARIDDGEADCVLGASRETFESLLAGDLDPAARRQVVVLGLEAIERCLGQVVGLCHKGMRLVRHAPSSDLLRPARRTWHPSSVDAAECGGGHLPPMNRPFTPVIIIL